MLTFLVESKPVKQEVSCTVILPHMVSGLWVSLIATLVEVKVVDLTLEDPGA